MTHRSTTSVLSAYSPVLLVDDVPVSRVLGDVATRAAVGVCAYRFVGCIVTGYGEAAGRFLSRRQRSASGMHLGSRPMTA